MKLEYLVLLLTSASDTAVPAKTDVLDRCKGAGVSGHVKSQSIERPPDQGLRVVPIGLLPSPLSSPGGLRMAGTPTLLSDRARMSFTA